MTEATVPTKQQVSSYFNRIRGNMGHQQLPRHLLSLPNWWTLRDTRGQTPLMHAFEAKGFSPGMLRNLMTTAPVRKGLLACDHRGRNLWYHLLLHQAYRCNTGLWVDELRDHVPLQASPLTQRGICTDLMLRNTKRQWAYFFPEGQFSRSLRALPGSSPATWLGADEFQAQSAMEWLLGVRKQSLGHRAATCLTWMAGLNANERQVLARPMRAGIMLMEFLHLSGPPVARHELENGVFIELPRKVRTRLEKEISAQNSRTQDRLWDVLRINDERVLEHHEALLVAAQPEKAHTQRPANRL